MSAETYQPGSDGSAGSTSPETPTLGWRRALVYGLGRSGTAAAHFLCSRGIEVVGVDRRSAPALDLAELERFESFEPRLGAEPEELPQGIDGVVVSPGVAPDRPLLVDAERRGVPILAEVELAFPFLEGPVVGITGSNGKSTTTAMTGALLEAAGFAVEVCGNIGVPLVSRVEGPRDRVFVVELSSFQLEGTANFRPSAAALLNISPDHIDRHCTVERYVAAKLRLLANQESTDCAVLNADDPWLREAGLATRARKRFFSRLGRVADGCYLDGDRVVEVEPEAGERELFRRSDVAQPGEHNLENAMAAALLARSLGAPPQGFGRALAGFAGLPHRMQTVAVAGGVRWIDDSKGTNVGAVLKSLEGFEDRSVHLILGGQAKGESFVPLSETVALKARAVYLIGEAAATIAEDLGPEAAGVRTVETLERAVADAHRRARSGETVLLSPACASFDQFRNFAHRGERFQELVREALGGRNGGDDG